MVEHDSLRLALLVSDFPCPSETWLADQARGLVARGHDVTVLPLTRAPAWRAEETSISGWTMHTPEIVRLRAHTWSASVAAKLLLQAPMREPRRVGAWLRHVIAQRGRTLPSYFEEVMSPGVDTYDVLVCHFGPNGIRGDLLRQAGRLRGRLVVIFHGFDANVLPKRFGRGMYRDLFARCDLVIANTQFLKDRVLALGSLPERTVRLPVGVAPDELLPREPGPVEGIKVLSVARLVEFKGIEYGIRAVAAARDAGHPLEYTIVGDGPLRNQLEALVAELGLGHAVRFLGSQPWSRVVEAFRENDIFLHPGVWASDGHVEAQGRVLLEAQLAEIPIIASRVGGIPEVVTAESTVLIEPKDVSGLAAALSEMASSSTRRLAMGRAGRTFAATHYDNRFILDHTVSLLRNVAQGRSVQGMDWAAPLAT